MPLETPAWGRKATSVASELVAAGPRTAAYAVRATLRPFRGERRHPEIPTQAPTPGLLISVFAEHAMMAALPVLFSAKDERDPQTVREELDRTIMLLDAGGWLADPRRFHQEPHPPVEPHLEHDTYRGLAYEKLTFRSDYRAPEGSSGEGRWDAPPNQTVHACVLRHPDGERPWLVLLHGAGSGSVRDFVRMGAGRFRDELGYNVIAPVAPYHGPRRVFARSGMGMMSSDYVRNLHSYSQAVWDIRRCISWAETQGAGSVAVYGVSMGGHLASLVAGTDSRISTVVVGVPAVDMAATVRRRADGQQAEELDPLGFLGESLDLVHRPVNPVNFPPLVPHEGRFIYAGVADKITTPGDAYLLWEHWDRPSVLWFRGTHVGTIRAKAVGRFVDDALQSPSGTA